MSSFPTEHLAKRIMQESVPASSSTPASYVTSRLAWLASGLLWRTFFLLAFLVAVSMAVWMASFRFVERAPRAYQIAAQVISIVTITRAALTHSAPDSRRELLFELASNEGIRVYPLEASDLIEPPTDTTLMPAIEYNVKQSLGNHTRFAAVVNGVAGFWVSFKIDDDEYWLMLDRERIEQPSGIRWLGWGMVTLLLSLLGAIFISRLINQPLAQLTAAARAIAKGRQPEPLPEAGPTEIREANRSFNQMTDDLQRVESDRAVILAGISHDLRTPITRMLLEVEMLAQMDAIINQFLDYAKPADHSAFARVDLSQLLTDTVNEATRLSDIKINAEIAPDITIIGHATELKRVCNNLIENARRYGKREDEEIIRIDVACRREGNQALLEIGDYGAGVPEHEIERLVRPFTRMDSARGQANGAGLGLAIVDRVIRRHHGSFKLENRAEGGLLIKIQLELAA